MQPSTSSSIPCAAEKRPVTMHVRVNVTSRDLAAMKASMIRTDRTSALCRAINRTLRGEYESTFDGMSVGVLDALSFVPSWENGSHIYEETASDGSTVCRRYRVSVDGVSAAERSDHIPFFRGVASRARMHHSLATAHRRVKPTRFTISLPAACLKRTIVAHSTEPLA